MKVLQIVFEIALVSGLVYFAAVEIVLVLQWIGKKIGLTLQVNDPIQDAINETDSMSFDSEEDKLNYVLKKSKALKRDRQWQIVKVILMLVSIALVIWFNTYILRGRM
jgi:hypothetical protein